MATPWGDPSPPFIELLDVRFAERPLDTLEGRLGDYASFLAGGLLLLLAALLAPLAARRPRRDVAAAAAITAIGLLAWATAPVTGLARSPLVTPPDVWALSTSRYLLPVIACAALALALLAKQGGARRTIALGALGGALAWSLVEDADLGLPFLPSAVTLAIGTLAGAGVAFVAARLRLPSPSPAWGALGAAAAGAFLAHPADGYIERHARFEQSSAIAGRRLAAFFNTQPGFDGDGRPIATVGRFLSAQVAGDKLQHRLELLPPDVPCAVLARRARDGWVVIVEPRVARGVFGVEPIPAARCRPTRRPLHDDGFVRVYSAAR